MASFLPSLVVLLLAGAGPNPDLDAAKEAFARAEYRQALARLEQAERSPTLDEAGLVELHWYRGVSLHVLGKRDEARRSFDALLALQPLYTPNRLETSPDIRAAFKERSDAYQREHGVVMATPVLKGAELSVSLSGHPEEVGALVVFARPTGAVRYQPFELKVEGTTARGKVPAFLFEEPAPGLDLVLEARNRRGAPLSRVGDAKEPVHLTVSDAERAAALRALGAGATATTSTPAAAATPPPASSPAPAPPAASAPTT
ncbi:MAG: hypothetical protein AB2A00_06635, partial [Myxococcota bacterium]